MAVGGQVGGDSTVGSVSSSSALNSSLGGDVRDLALLNIKTLSFSVALEVSKESNHVLDGLLRPSTVMVVHLLAHGVSARSTGVSSEGDDALVLKASLEVLDGSGEHESSAGSGSLVCVLVVCSQVVNSA